MDTTKKYISMCGQAKEIQDSHKPEEWDYCWAIENTDEDRPAKVNVISGTCTDCGHYGLGTDSIEPEGDRYTVLIWLPRQDQLQDMIKLVGDSIDLFILNDFNNFTQSIWRNFITMEQLWLAFVMCENYNKTWVETEQKWAKIQLNISTMITGKIEQTDL